MKLFLLDIATSTGWVLAEVNDKREIVWMESGVEVFKTLKNESNGVCFFRFRSWFRDRVDEFHPDLVVYEQPHLRGKAATTVLMGYVTRLIEVCDLWEDEPGKPKKIPYATVATSTLKKWATGKGNAGKPEMIEAAAKAFPDITIQNDDHADALNLLRYAIANFV